MDNILIGKRINEARKFRNMTFDDIADDIGVSKSTVQRYEAGKIAKIKIPVLHAIANSLGVNPVWISGYDAPMIDTKPEQKEGIPLTNDEKSLLDKYRFLDDHGKDMVDTVADKEYERCKNDQENTVRIDEEFLKGLPIEERLPLLSKQEEYELRRVARKK